MRERELQVGDKLVWCHDGSTRTVTKISGDNVEAAPEGKYNATALWSLKRLMATVRAGGQIDILPMVAADVIATQEKRTVSVTYQPCRIHNMPLPCVECGLNARYAAEHGRDEVAKMLGRERYRQMGEKLHASLPVIRPWAMMAGVQGPGWNRR